MKYPLYRMGISIPDFDRKVKEGIGHFNFV